MGRPSEYLLLRRETKLYSKTRGGSAKAAARHTTLEASAQLSGALSHKCLLSKRG